MFQRFLVPLRMWQKSNMQQVSRVSETKPEYEWHLDTSACWDAQMHSRRDPDQEKGVVADPLWNIRLDIPQLGWPAGVKSLLSWEKRDVGNKKNMVKLFVVGKLQITFLFLFFLEEWWVHSLCNPPHFSWLGSYGPEFCYIPKSTWCQHLMSKSMKHDWISRELCERIWVWSVKEGNFSGSLAQRQNPYEKIKGLAIGKIRNTVPWLTKFSIAHVQSAVPLEWSRSVLNDLDFCHLSILGSRAASTGVESNRCQGSASVDLQLLTSASATRPWGPGALARYPRRLFGPQPARGGQNCGTHRPRHLVELIVIRSMSGVRKPDPHWFPTHLNAYQALHVDPVEKKKKHRKSPNGYGSSKTLVPSPKITPETGRCASSPNGMVSIGFSQRWVFLTRRWSSGAVPCHGESQECGMIGCTSTTWGIHGCVYIHSYIYIYNIM